ncbi:hypothetical protein [Thalassorhabdomicrobium marinisediminis]|uniref:hypothetical protein n=1 Tax=Thalassorhabdomicrobium marinisediminis TaxID=2170577 RepID=UPI00248F5670|nr:hypothetical protein [Thalassorhabdomicrobium marinisediminis]
MSGVTRDYVWGRAIRVGIWFVVITIVVHLYSAEQDPMPVSVLNRLLAAAFIVALFSLPPVRWIGRIYLNTTPPDDDLDD